MKELPTLPNFMTNAGQAALVAGGISAPATSGNGPGKRTNQLRPKADREPPNRVQAIRLAAAMEKLHDTAHDSSQTEAAGVTAAQTLAMTMLEHFPTIIWALKKAGGAKSVR